MDEMRGWTGWTLEARESTLLGASREQGEQPSGQTHGHHVVTELSQGTYSKVICKSNVNNSKTLIYQGLINRGQSRDRKSVKYSVVLTVNKS